MWSGLNEELVEKILSHLCGSHVLLCVSAGARLLAFDSKGRTLGTVFHVEEGVDEGNHDRGPWLTAFALDSASGDLFVTEYLRFLQRFPCVPKSLLRDRPCPVFESNIRDAVERHHWTKPESVVWHASCLYVTCSAPAPSLDSVEGAVLAISHDGIPLRVLAQGGGLSDALWSLCVVPHHALGARAVLDAFSWEGTRPWPGFQPRHKELKAGGNVADDATLLISDWAYKLRACDLATGQLSTTDTVSMNGYEPCAGVGGIEFADASLFFSLVGRHELHLTAVRQGLFGVSVARRTIHIEESGRMYGVAAGPDGGIYVADKARGIIRLDGLFGEDEPSPVGFLPQDAGVGVPLQATVIRWVSACDLKMALPHLDWPDVAKKECTLKRSTSRTMGDLLERMVHHRSRPSVEASGVGLLDAEDPSGDPKAGPELSDLD